MNNLTKENFFNDLRKQYPAAVDYFSQWIDKYKQEVNWNELFGEKVKFHDIPFEMQNGILARFELELFNNRAGRGKEEYSKVANIFKGQLKALFADLQTGINDRSVKLN